MSGILSPSRRSPMACAILVYLSLPASASTPSDLTPGTMMLALGHYDVAHVLREFEKQTGNRIADRRSKTSPAKVEIGFSGQSFWPALEQLAEKLDARISYYGDEGIALAD